MVAVFTNSTPRHLKIAGVETVAVRERGPLKKNLSLVKNNRDKQLPSFKLIEVDSSVDDYLAYMLDAKLVAAGLNSGETVVLISIEESGYVMRRLVKSGLNVELLRNQWKFVVYTLSMDQVQPEGLLDFEAIISDIKVLCRGEIGRIIFPDLDLLLSLEEPQLAYEQLKIIHKAAYSEQVKLIAHYQLQTGFEQKVIEKIAQAVVPHYFIASLSKTNSNKSSALQLIPKNIKS